MGAPPRGATASTVEALFDGDPLQHNTSSSGDVSHLSTLSTNLSDGVSQIGHNKSCCPLVSPVCAQACANLRVSLSTEHLAVAVPVAVISAVGGFLVSQYLSRRCCTKGLVNTCISKDSPKVVHSFDMEDIGSKAVYCRCWKSKKVRQPSPRCSPAERSLDSRTV